MVLGLTFCRNLFPSVSFLLALSSSLPNSATARIRRTLRMRRQFVLLTSFMAFERTVSGFQCHEHRGNGRVWRHSPHRIPLFVSTSRSNTDATDITADNENMPTAQKIPSKFVPKPFEYHQEIEIKIDSLTNMGWGVGRVALNEEETAHDHDEDSDTANERLWVVMVPHVIVGETVRVRIFKNMKNYSEADLVRVVEASPDRVQPQCGLAGICGGCQYQHMSIAAQREWKQKHVQEVLLQQQIEGYDTPEKVNVLPTAGTHEVYHYRSKLTPHYQAPVEQQVESSDSNDASTTTYHLEAVGFQKSSNRQLVDVPECPIATPAINEKYQETRERLYEHSRQGLLNSNSKKKKRKKRGSRNGALGATLLFRQADDDAETGEPVVVTDNNECMTTTVKGIRFRYQAGNFFQNNNYVLPLMVDAVVDAATHLVTATGRPPSYLIDCYCGSGLFALSAAKEFKLCVGIEVNEKAIGEATDNAKLNGIATCQFMAASAEAIFTSPPEITVAGFEQLKVQTLDRQETVVVLDPPRKGCSEEFLKQLYEYSPQRIVYMSCGPATQARDAKGIVEKGGYTIVSIQPFDLFPQTKHIESLIVFEKQ